MISSRGNYVLWGDRKQDSFVFPEHSQQLAVPLPCNTTRMRSLFHRLFVRRRTGAFDTAGGGRRLESVRLPSFPGHSQRL